jgi:hypothetical protein
MEMTAHHYRSHRDVVIKALSVVVLLGILGGLFSLVPSANKPMAQVVGAAGLFAVLWRVSLFGVRIPRILFVVATVAVGVGAFIRFSYANLSRGAVVVATLSSRDLEQDKRMYRDRLRRALGNSYDSLVGIHHGRVDTNRDVEKVLGEFPSVGAVLWGTPRWMTLSFRPAAPISLSDVSTASTGGRLVADGILPNLAIVRALPDVSLSQGQHDASVYFIAKLVLTWSQFAGDSVGPENDAEFDQRLDKLVRMPTRGAGRAHLAAPMWIRGTYHLIKAIRSPEADKEDLTKAIVSFKFALSELRKGGNPALQAAARNNYAVALLVEFSRDTRRKNLRKAAGKHFTAAVRVGSPGGVGGATAADNLAALQAAGVFPRR